MAFNDEQITIVPMSVALATENLGERKLKLQGEKKNEKDAFFAASTGHSSSTAPLLKRFVYHLE